MNEPVTRTCTACERPFVISIAEQAYFVELGQRQGGTWGLPRRCLPCRKASRRARHAVQEDIPDGWYELVCVACGAAFKLGPRDVEYFRARGFQWPRRCRLCRSAASQAQPHV